MQPERIHIGGDRPTELELHPRMTVVGCDRHTLEDLTDALPEAWLDATGDELPVVGPEVLPPPDTARTEAHLDRLRGELRAAEARVVGATKEANREERRHRAATAAADADRDDLAEVEARLEDLTGRREELAGRAAEVEGEVGQAAGAAEAAAARGEELAGIRDRLEQLLPVPDGAVHWRLGDHPDELAGLLDRAAELTDPTAGPLGEARRWVEALGAGTAPVHPEARALAEADIELERRWADAASAGIDGDPEVVEAAARLDRVTADVDGLGALSAAGTLGATARREIERAHRAAVNAGDRDAEAARAEEARVVTHYGYDSYLDFTVSTRSVRDVVEGRLQALRDERTTAEDELRAAREHAAHRIEELSTAREKLHRRAAEVLGHPPGDSPAPELLRVPQIPPALGRIPADLVDACGRAAADRERHAAEAGALEAERTRLRRELAKLSRAVARAESRRDTLEPKLAGIDGRLADGSRAVAEAAERRDRALAARDLARAALTEVHSAEPAHTAEDLPAVVAAVVAAVTEAAPSTPEPRPVLLVETFTPLGALAADALDLLADDTSIRSILLTADDDVVRRVEDGGLPGVGVFRPRRHGLRGLRQRWGRRRAGAQRRPAVVDASSAARKNSASSNSPTSRRKILP